MFAGVIVTAFVPPVDLLMIIFTCPSPPSANVTGAFAAVALIRVVDSVTLTAPIEDPSPVKL